MIIDEPVRGSYPDPRMLGLSGLRQMRLFFERRGPIPPIAHLTGLMPTKFGEDETVFEMPVTPWLASPPGMVQGGVLAILADAPLGSAIHSKLPPAVAYTTAEINLYFLRPIPATEGRLVATARAIQVGRSLALSEVRVEDGDGRLVAHGTSRCYVFPPLDPAPEPPDDLAPVPPPEGDPPDPYLRPVEGEVLPQEVWSSTSGLDILRAQIAGDLPAPPLSSLTGLRPTEVEEGSATVVMPASEWLCSPLALVQGGATAMLADISLACAVQTTIPAGTAYAPLDLKTNFLRPVVADGRELTARARVLHRGKTLAVAGAEIVNADGKVVMLASGTSQILPGRNAALI